MFESPCKKGVADAFFLCGAGGWVRQRSRAGASRAIVEAFDASRQRGPRVDYRELEGRSRFEMNARPMPKLPNSFLSRLRAQTPATLDAVSAPHPDADTLAAAGMLAPRLPPVPRTVTLFDLSERNLARHAGSLDQEFRALR